MTDGTQDPVDARAEWKNFARAFGDGINGRLTAIAGLAALQRERAEAPASDTRMDRWAEAGDAARNHWNAMTVVYLVGVIDAHIESLGPSLGDAVGRGRQQQRDDYMRAIRTKERGLREAGAPPDKIKLLRQFSVDLLKRLTPPLPSARFPFGVPAGDRWEDALGRVYLGAAHARPMPEDLRRTLNEIGEVRNVLLHRMGFVDDRLLAQNFEGPWRVVGERVVIGVDDYRRHIAALYAYSEEIVDRFRLVVGAPARHDIQRWRDMIPAGG